MDRALLRAVSRSFALTIEWLPRAVRDPIALGYLLARASDTIADSPAAPISERAAALEELRAGTWPTQLPAADHAGEAELLRRLPELRAALMASPHRDRITSVWREILRGQLFDLTRFGPGAPPLTPAEFDDYTYAVAGCVGDFWTHVCAAELPRFARRSLEEMCALGVAYGKGLQRVNVLRDRRADAALGRVYVPTDRFAVEHAAAESGLRAGLEWAAAVRVRRVRFACVLPARIGLATLPGITADGPPAKIRRSEVRRILWRSLPMLLRP